MTAATFKTPLLLAALVAALLPASPAQTGAPDRDRHVVVISLDGFPAYALRDPNIPLPVLRRLMREGGAAERMKPVNPTVTWPNHTAMVTGVNAARHGVIYNGLPVRGGDGRPLHVEPWAPKSELVQARTVYDAAHDAGLTTAEVDWVAIYNAAGITWSFPEEPKPDGAFVREMLDQGALTKDELQRFSKASVTLRDDIWTRAAAYVIEKHRPNLLLFHLLAADDVEHEYGARALAAHTALVLADRQVQRVLDAVDRAGIRSRTTVLVVSDHGFRTYRHSIRPNVLLRQKGLLRDRGGQVDCDAWTVAEGGTAMVYVTREAKRAATLQVLKDAFSGVAGIAKVIWPADYAAYGYPPPKAGGRMSDLVLAAMPGYAFDGGTRGDVVADVPAGATPGTHGYLNSDSDMDAILVAWGAGIRPGSQAGVVPNVNVAATIARLLDLKFTGIEGTPVVQLLK